ncbi:MAG: helix-turn-helix domain-containing protein [Phycisphaerae bacterium]
MNQVMTIEQVAEFLQVEEDYIEALLTSGRLPGFKLGGQWRIRQEDIAVFLQTKVEEQQKAYLREVLKDPKQWASQLPQFPDFLKKIEEEDFPDDSFGKFLQDGWNSLG